MRHVIAAVAVATVIAPSLGAAANSTAAKPAGDETGPVMTASLMKAGILPANNRRDLLDIRTLFPEDGAPRMAIAARAGTTGRQLWRRTFKGKVPLNLFVEPVGGNGKRGVVRVIHHQRSMTLEALSGVDGHQLWSQTIGGTAGSDGIVDVPGDVSVLHGAGGASNYLVDVVTRTATDTTTTAEVVSGADGMVSRLGAPVTTTDRFAGIQAAPDVSGDGLDDVLVVVDGPNGFIRAENGVTGDSLWTYHQSLNFASMVAIGAFSQPGTSDIAVYNSDPDSDDVCNGENASAPCPGSKVTVLQGSTGSALWTRSATTVVPIRTAGKHQVAAVLVATLRAGGNEKRFRGSYHYAAITPTNRVVYDKRIKLAGKKLPHQRPFSDGSLSLLGDVQPDGSRDVAYSLRISAKVPSNTDNKVTVGVIDGRSGVADRYPSHADPDLSARAPAVGSLRKGPGTDLIQVTNKALRLRITAYDGATRKRLYSRVVPVGRGDYGGDGPVLFGLRVSGHRCSEIATQTSAGHHVLSVLTARARVLWTLSFKPLALKGGTLVHHTPKHSCVS